jgi:hypothetical protein
VNEGSKYPIISGYRKAIECGSAWCAVFGTNGNVELVIQSDSNYNTESFCNANRGSFNLPKASGLFSESDSSSINGGSKHF